MKYLLTLLSFIVADFHYNIAYAQQINNTQNDLKGEMKLNINVSDMKDTSGKFMIRIGGEFFYPEIKNNILTVNILMKEPRKSVLAFYPLQKIQANPDQPLNYISTAVSDYFEFLALPGEYKIDVKGTIANSEIINAAPHQKKYAALLKLKENFNTIMLEKHTTLLKEVENAKDKPVKDSLISIFYKDYKEEFPKYYQDTILGFVKYNPDAPASLLELEEYSQDNKKDLKTLTFLFNNITDRLKALPTAQRIYNTIDGESFAVNSLVGKPVLDFTQNDLLGKAVSLKDFKGHVTLLEFWASWCGPCRESNPALVKTYRQYREKGFRILGVSLDNKKENWLHAIKEDGLDWTNVSDLKGFQNAAAELYHIYSIPANFLIDKFGKIVASDLDEKELNEYLEKLLK